MAKNQQISNTFAKVVLVHSHVIEQRDHVKTIYNKVKTQNKI